MTKIRMAVIVCLLFLFISDRQVKAMEISKEKVPEKIRVAYPIQENLTEIDEEGNYSGYTYEYLRKLSQMTGWEYEFVQVPGDINESLTTLFTMLENGEIDLMGCLVKDETTVGQFDFQASGYGTAYSTLAVLDGNRKVNEVNLANVSDFKIAVMEKSVKRKKELNDFCKANKIRAELVECKTGEDAYKALAEGKADAILGVDLSPYEGTKIVAKFGGAPYYFATTKGNAEVLQKLNTAMIQLEATDPYFQTRLYERYFNNVKSEFVLSPEEKKYVEKNPLVRVFISAEVAPFQYKKGEKREGSVISILDDFAKETGFQIEYVERDADKDMQEQLRSKQFDFALGVPYDYDFAAKYDLLLSTPYITLPTILFSKSAANINELQNKKLVLTTGGEPVDELKDCETVYAKNLEECIRAVDSGKADFGYANSYSLGYYFSKGVYPNMIMFPLFNQEKSYCFGFQKPADAQLLVLLNRYLKNMDDSRVYTDLVRQISSVDRNIGMIDYIKLNPAKIAGVFFTAILIFASIVFYFVKSRQKEKILKAQNEAQGRFLSNMSHEMRTPLNTIIGLNSLAMENIQDINYVKDSMNKIDVASNHLLQLINDVLDMSKISEGKMHLQVKPFDVVMALQSITTIYQLNAKDKNVKLRTEIDRQIEKYVIGDELRLKQVLINLLLNGIKYNKEGGEVLLNAELSNKTEDSQCVCFTVIDTGCGILEENKKRIFNAFEREERENVHGTGLGLAISHEIVTLMQSELKLETKAGQGSKFWFTVEFTLAKEEDILCLDEKKQFEKNQGEQVSFEGIRFLLFEDNEINATIVKKLIESKKGEVVLTENGKEGCELFEESPEGYYDMLLMDIRMPVMDGYEATQYIRNLDRKDALTIPIFALSANAFSEDVERSHEVGMNEHIAKPIDSKNLFMLIQKYCEK